MIDLAKERELFEHWIDTSFYTYDEFANKYEQDGIGSDPEYKETLNVAWDMWQQRAEIEKREYGPLKAQLAQYQSDDYVLVPKKELSTWYLNEAEGLWTDEPDNFLCEIEAGQVFTVQLQHNFSLPDEYIARPWSEAELDVDHYQVYATKEEAEQVALHCKAMIEAQEQDSE